MKAIEERVKEEDKEFVKAYGELINRIAAMTIHNEYLFILDKYKKATCIEAAKLPALSEGKLIGIKPLMPIGQAINEMK